MNDKQRVAEHAAALVQDGMLIGLGTGSTANYFIEAVARRCRDEGLKIEAVASSVVSTIKARQAGLSLKALEHIDKLDIYVDGADEVTPDLTLLKGRGSDLVREKLLAKASSAFWVLIDQTKQVERIGQNYPIPVEVIPFAWQLVLHSLTQLGGEGRLRVNGDGLAVTSHGSLVLDVRFATERDSKTLNDQLNAIPGVVEHGIFQGLTTAVFCGQDHQVLEKWA